MSTKKSKQIDMSGIRLKPDLSIGCCQINRADSLPLSETFVCLSQSEISITLYGETKAPWDGLTHVTVFMFKYPHGRNEFEYTRWAFFENRKRPARLPEGIPFSENILAIKKVPATWEHSAFAPSGREFIHVYSSKRFGIVVRFYGKKGSILDNPLIKRVHRSLRFVEDQWMVKYPDTEPRRKASLQTKSYELTSVVQSELQDAISQARNILHLERNARPNKVINSIHDCIEKIRAKKRVKVNHDDMAIAFGALWGDVLCKADQWQWQNVVPRGSKGITSVVNVNRSFAVNPFALIHRILRSKRIVNNAMLLFNMICSGDMPDTVDNSYRWLS